MAHLLLAVIYLSFISLGLPDAMLGSAWPTMYRELQVPVSYAGSISMIISIGSVVSSLQSDRLTRKLGAGMVTAVSVLMTATALFGFSVSHSFAALCLWAVPYGLGAGSVDAAINNYAALHYKSRHMSWLHCMWGIGASTGPFVMEAALTGGLGWNAGFRIVSIVQAALTAVIFLSLPLWKQEKGEGKSAGEENVGKPLTFSETLGIPGAKAIMLVFFCYCSLELTTGLWASSYLNLHLGYSAEEAAGYAAWFYLGITAGRAGCGFLSILLSDHQMIRLGQAVIALGIAVMLLPFSGAAPLGLVVIGVGCAPIYPSVMHSVPVCFGADKSQAIIGMQMASAYIGNCTMPPLFGLIAEHLSAAFLPVFQVALLAGMAVMHRILLKKTYATA